MITVFIMMLLVGTVTSTVAYSQKTSLQTAAREGSRFGATLPVNSDITTWLTRVLQVTKNASNKDLGSGVHGQSICVAYVYPNGTAAGDRNTRLQETAGVVGAPTSGASATCFNDGRPNDERRVQVLVGRKATVQAVLFSKEVQLPAQSVARFERGS